MESASEPACDSTSSVTSSVAVRGSSDAVEARPLVRDGAAAGGREGVTSWPPRAAACLLEGLRAFMNWPITL